MADQTMGVKFYSMAELKAQQIIEVLDVTIEQKGAKGCGSL